MSIARLSLKNFRNLSDVAINTSPQFNIFYGENGSGKTSLLEAIYYLGHCRSFRSNQVANVIEHGQPNLQIYAELLQNEQISRMGLERSIRGGRSIRLNGESVKKISSFAEKLPIQYISTENYRFFHDGPKRRRQFIDWGVFHVEHQFYPLWADLQKAYKQRNACLKNYRVPSSEIEAWNQQLTTISKPIDDLRCQYIQNLKPIFQDLLQSLLNIEIEMRYFRGWDHQKELYTVLRENIQRDMALGYTYYGPNRADLQLYTENDTPAQEFLSQGQQKTVSYALSLAQGILMQDLVKKSPVYLIDDLPSELDPQKRRNIANVIETIKAQVFMTGITKHDLHELLDFSDLNLYLVQKGVITEQQA